jgi:hypothetical protein
MKLICLWLCFYPKASVLGEFSSAILSQSFDFQTVSYGTAKSGVGISAMSVLRPDMMMKCVVPVIMAGIIAVSHHLSPQLPYEQTLTHPLQYIPSRFTDLWFRSSSLQSVRFHWNPLDVAVIQNVLLSFVFSKNKHASRPRFYAAWSRFGRWPRRSCCWFRRRDCR